MNNQEAEHTPVVSDYPTGEDNRLCDFSVKSGDGPSKDQSSAANDLTEEDDLNNKPIFVLCQMLTAIEWMMKTTIQHIVSIHSKLILLFIEGENVSDVHLSNSRIMFLTL
ncbi:hypothetical protein JTB14_023249 [Gonioctena quinquepunctata]|nr:hypothetical protein JTB14_023249 [Gonioctena quinquepunctata]